MKPALGKGLSALIPEKEKKEAGGVLEIPVKSIVPNENQPRRTFDDDALAELVSSIKEKGVIQPVIVRKLNDDRYELIAGERRWRASRSAGLNRIPAIVKDAAPAEALELALIENIQREDLNPLETAEAFYRLISEFNLTHEELSRRVSKDRATVTNYLRILKLPEEVKSGLAGGELTLGHAKALLQLPDSRSIKTVYRKIKDEGLSVRETEALCKRSPFKKSKKPAAAASKDPQIASLEERLMHSLGTKVRLVHKSNKRGKIEIEYYSLDDLDRLLDILLS
jgi:ParB family chromosome partitioning protein